MGRVIGLTTTSAARENLAGVCAHIEGYDLAQFLGHDLELGREARGTVAIGPDALILLDEATTASQPDMAAAIVAAQRQGAKVVMTGDSGQQEAVEAGGGFALLTRRKAHAQLTEAERLIHAGELESEWEGGCEHGAARLVMAPMGRFGSTTTAACFAAARTSRWPRPPRSTTWPSCWPARTSS